MVPGALATTELSSVFTESLAGKCRLFFLVFFRQNLMTFQLVFPRGFHNVITFKLNDNSVDIDQGGTRRFRRVTIEKARFEYREYVKAGYVAA